MNCQQCAFYREPQRVIAALESAAPRTPDVNTALQKIAQQQNEQREAEFEYWIQFFYSEPEHARWPRRPTASPYCGHRKDVDAATPRDSGGWPWRKCATPAANAQQNPSRALSTRGVA